MHLCVPGERCWPCESRRQHKASLQGEWSFAASGFGALEDAFDKIVL